MISLNLIDKLIIGIADNLNKAPLFTISERKKLIESDLEINFDSKDNISVKFIDGLLTNFASFNNASCIIRGLRVVSDFEYEFQMTGMNYQLNPSLETIFLMSADNNSFISSNLVKEVHKLGGDVSKFVTPTVNKQLLEKF